MKVVIVGAGNVATHIGRAICRCHEVLAVCCRTLEHASCLANELGARVLTDIRLLPPSDICLIAISDNEIENISTTMPSTDGIVVHTSGATKMSVLQNHKHSGVIYPCQTFTREDKLDFAKVPLFVEASDDATREILINFAKSLSSMVAYADSQDRARLHVAAVLASNYTNRLLCLAHDYMERQGLPFDMIRPLVEQTIHKAFSMNPYDAQTGPARRNDTQTIERHLQLIDTEQLRCVYKLLSDDIIKAYN